MIKQQIAGIFSIICIIILEVLIDYANMQLHLPFNLFCLNDITVAFYMTICVFITSILFNRKYINFSLNWTNIRNQILLLVNNSCSGSILDILFVLVFIFNLAWIPDAVSDIAKDGGYFYRPFMYIAGLFLMIYTKPRSRMPKTEISKTERKILITGLSDVKYSNFKGKISTNLEPVIKPLSQYPNIEILLILLSTEITNSIVQICENVPREHPLYKYFKSYKNAMQNFISKKERK